MDERNVSSFNHGDALLAYFQGLQDEGRFLDVSIQTEGHYLSSAHRLILAAFSDHFYTALAPVQGSSTITLDIDPKITGVSPDDLKRIVDYMYSGRVEYREELINSSKALGCNALASLLISSRPQPPGTLIQDGHHTTKLMERFQEFYTNGKFTDVTINCQNVALSSCHRLVLCAFSNHFETALLGTESCPLVTLDIDSAVTGVTNGDLRTIVDFMYSGTLRIPKRRIKNLTGAARSLGVSKLVEAMTECQRQQYAYARAVAGTSSSSGGIVPVLIGPSSSGSFVDGVDDVVVGGGRLAHHQQVVSPHHHHQAVLGNASHHVNSHHHQLAGVHQHTSQIAHDSSFDVHAVGATEDVGSTPIDDSGMDLLVGIDGIRGATGSVCNNLVGGSGLMGDNEGPGGRELTAADDYVDIYEEYVSGPRRGRRGGTYGRAANQSMKMKPLQSRLALMNANNSSKLLSALVDGPSSSGTSPVMVGPQASSSSSAADEYSIFVTGGGASDGAGPVDHVSAAAAASTSSDSFASLADEPPAAVTMSFTPTGKRRKVTDSYGYGLPEIIGTNDITVPLLVGDQELMMEKPFKCPYCPHRTKEKSAVEKHIRCIHTLEAPYKCRYCNQAFKVQSNLVRHIRAHTGEKPYCCRKCGAAYADKKNMDAHVFREHLKMKPLECPASGCTAKFWRQDRFNYHCRRQHSFEPPPPEERQ